tara:strand:- start:1564 stop:2619 length:1056 start_codon:yes stop_codon:yes gene_type:complete
MSNYDKKFLKDKYKELEKDLSKPEVRQPNDHVLLIDGLNTFIRAFSVNPSLNEDGSHVGGLVGFLKSVRFAVNKFKPTRCIIVFDGKGGSKPRQKIYSQYKAGRKVRSRLNRNVDWATNPQDEQDSMRLQIGRLIEYLEHLPLTLLALDKLEADDIISYVTNVTLKESKTTIMSTDKDFLQLVSPRVQLYSPTKKITYDEELVKKEFGIYPQNMLTCRVIDGDKSDGIPGVRGIGIKTLIKEFPELTQNEKFDIKRLMDSASSKTTKPSKLINDNEYIIKRNYLLMQLKDPDIANHTKLKITDAVNSVTPQLIKYKFQRLFVEDKLWGQIPNFDNWVTEFMILDRYWRGNE